MAQPMLLCSAAVLIFGWGVAHLMPTKTVVRGFGDLTADNRRILMMEWIAEGLTLCFLGVLVALVTATGVDGGWPILWAVAAMLVAMAALSAFTGARTAVLPMKLCPVVKTVAAGLIVAGTTM